MRNLKELNQRLEEIEKDIRTPDQERALRETLRAYSGKDEVISFQEHQKTQESREIVHYKTGLSKLDAILTGFHDGDLVVLTGETGQGKTSILQELTKNLSRNQIKSLWFTYEVPIQQLLFKFGQELPDGYAPRILGERSAVWIERRIVEAIVKYGIKAVFIDPFNYLAKYTSNNLSQELGEKAQELKDIALRYNILLFTAAHVSKANTQDGVITTKSIRDTELLAHTADTILAVWRVPQKQNKDALRNNGMLYTNETAISVIKNRYDGKLGSLKLLHNDGKYFEGI